MNNNNNCYYDGSPPESSQPYQQQQSSESTFHPNPIPPPPQHQQSWPPFSTPPQQQPWLPQHNYFQDTAQSQSDYYHNQIHSELAAVNPWQKQQQTSAALIQDGGIHDKFLSETNHQQQQQDYSVQKRGRGRPPGRGRGRGRTRVPPPLTQEQEQKHKHDDDYQMIQPQHIGVTVPLTKLRVFRPPSLNPQPYHLMQHSLQLPELQATHISPTATNIISGTPPRRGRGRRPGSRRGRGRPPGSAKYFQPPPFIEPDFGKQFLTTDDQSQSQDEDDDNSDSDDIDDSCSLEYNCSSELTEQIPILRRRGRPPGRGRGRGRGRDGQRIIFEKTPLIETADESKTKRGRGRPRADCKSNKYPKQSQIPKHGEERIDDGFQRNNCRGNIILKYICGLHPQRNQTVFQWSAPFCAADLSKFTFGISHSTPPTFRVQPIPDESLHGF